MEICVYFSPLCCIGSCRQSQNGSLVCLFVLLCFGSSEEQQGDVLEGCAGWFCSLTNEVEVGAALSSREHGDDRKYAEIVMPPVLPQSRRGRQSSGGTKMIIFQVRQDLEKFGRAFSSKCALILTPGSRSYVTRF